jgi:hypothetical protein
MIEDSKAVTSTEREKCSKNKCQAVFNKPISEAGLLNECLCIAQALGVTKFINVRDMILITLYGAT